MSIEAAARETPPGQLLVAFERLSGQTLRLSYSRQSSLGQLYERGVRTADIEAVWHFTRAMMAKGKCGFNELSLSFGAMLADPDRFEDRLAAARAWRRPKTAQEPATVAEIATVRPAPAQRSDPALGQSIAKQLGEFKARLSGKTL